MYTPSEIYAQSKNWFHDKLRQWSGINSLVPYVPGGPYAQWKGRVCSACMVYTLRESDMHMVHALSESDMYTCTGTHRVHTLWEDVHHYSALRIQLEKTTCTQCMVHILRENDMHMVRGVHTLREGPVHNVWCTLMERGMHIAHVYT